MWEWPGEMKRTILNENQRETEMDSRNKTSSKHTLLEKERKQIGKKREEDGERENRRKQGMLGNERNCQNLSHYIF